MTTQRKIKSDVKAFYDAVYGQKYYDSFNVNSKNYRQQSPGTKRFFSELEKLMNRCIRAATRKPGDDVRQALDMLFQILRQLDNDAYDIVFIADEPGSEIVYVDWPAAIAAYAKCLGHEVSNDEFIETINRLIEDFADYQREDVVTALRKELGPARTTGLRKLSATSSRS